MDKFISPLALSHLQAFRFWLRGSTPEYDISLPEECIVEVGKDYPPFHLYRHGMPIGMIASPMEVLEKIGNIQLIHEYGRLMTEDPDDSKG